MTPHPIVATLAERTRQQRITATRLATLLGVSQPVVSRWQSGHRQPTWGHAIAWAEQLGMRLIVHDGRAVVTDGQTVAGHLAGLRRHRGLTQEAVGRLRHVHPSAVTRLERAAAGGSDPHLGTVDAHLRTLGLGLAVMEAS